MNLRQVPTKENAMTFIALGIGVYALWAWTLSKTTNNGMDMDKWL